MLCSPASQGRRAQGRTTQTVTSTFKAEDAAIRCQLAGGMPANLRLGSHVTVGIGVDVVDLDRFESIVSRRPRFVDRVFTADEREYCDRARQSSIRSQRYAARFAAKEAVMKVLGCGLGGYAFHDVSVVRDEESGEPGLVVHGKAAALAGERGITRWHLSLTHSDAVAIAFVVAD